MASAVSAHLLVINLGNDLETASVLRRFDHHRSVVGGRATKSRRNDGDVEMGFAENNIGSDTLVGVNISRLAISSDGQWLASSDDHSRTHIFNLDSLQVMFFWIP
jgi:U3 small nucleolar RNA-associated protein 4